jgi:hypothetical protein
LLPQVLPGQLGSVQSPSPPQAPFPSVPQPLPQTLLMQVAPGQLGSLQSELLLQSPCPSYPQPPPPQVPLVQVFEEQLESWQSLSSLQLLLPS